MTVMDRTKPDGDAALVEALRREDPEAPEQLVETYGDRVYRLALRITGSNEDAEEAAQDALWTAARKISTFKGESAFGSWLYRIAANAAYQKLRARKSKAHEIAIDDVLPTFDEDGRHFEPMAPDPGGPGRAVMGHAGMRLIVEQARDARLARELGQGPLQQFVRRLGWEGEAELDHPRGLVLRHGEAARGKVWRRAGEASEEATPAHMSLQEATALRLGIGSGHRANGDAEAIGEVAVGRQAVTGLQLPGIEVRGDGIGDGAIARSVMP